MCARNGECGCHKGMLIGLYGYPGVGKDAVASILVDHYDWVRVAFADPMKEMLLALDPICFWDGEYQYERLSALVRVFGSLDEAKRRIKDIRTYLQKLGKEGGRDVLGENVWVDAAMRRVDAAYDEGKNIVITDVRFPNELDRIVLAGGTIVRVDRPGYKQLNDHASEQYYDTFVPDYILHNDGDLGELLYACGAMLYDLTLA